MLEYRSDLMHVHGLIQGVPLARIRLRRPVATWMRIDTSGLRGLNRETSIQDAVLSSRFPFLTTPQETPPSLPHTPYANRDPMHRFDNIRHESIL